jgi:hypothetical protein
MRPNGIEGVAFIASQFAKQLMEREPMPVSSCDEPSSRNLTSNSPARANSDAVSIGDYPLNVAVTYAPLVVWRDSHWVCAVKASAPMSDRLE